MHALPSTQGNSLAAQRKTAVKKKFTYKNLNTIQFLVFFILNEISKPYCNIAFEGLIYLIANPCLAF